MELFDACDGVGRTDTRGRFLRSVSALAVCPVLLYAGSASAQDAEEEGASPTSENVIVVTATRRSEDITDIPFNISAYDGEQLARANITSVTALTQQVPNFVIQDTGLRNSSGSIPIIRGINASQTTIGNSSRYFQGPVGFYLGNAPITGSIPLFDIERVEVLRGPQGTLYGAGALSGAVRLVPNSPKLGNLEGMVTGSISSTSHSSDPSYSFGGLVNFPLGNTVAIRFAAKHEYEGGFIDQHNIFERENDDYLSGKPVLANPADPAFSSGVLFDKADANWARVSSVRAALLWEPTPETKVELAYNYSYLKGNGAPIETGNYAGGSFPIDPRITVGPAGKYERSIPTLEPWNRRTHLASLDVSQDLGFATLSTTFALGHTEGFSVGDSTVSLLGVPYGYYYTGAPANPRTVVPVNNADKDRSTTEEIRLVSNGDGPFSYILGVFFQQQSKDIILGVYSPGASEQSAAANGGSTLPIAAGGTYIVTRPNGASYDQIAEQTFRDYSVYGELGYQITDKWKITGGARFFHQTFSQHFTGESQFFFYLLDETQKNSVSSQIFKINTSYELGDRLQAYATWSQGFRRGGANAFPLAGFALEPRELIVYTPDKTNNYEVGLKGNAAGVNFSFDFFYVDWSDPQIDLLTPFNLANAVVNGSKATSKGFELEAFGPLGDSGFSFNMGLAYAKARIAEDFGLPAGANGAVIPNAIVGLKGDHLPGAPDWTGSFTLNYDTELDSSNALGFSIGVDYRGATFNNLNSSTINLPVRESDEYALVRGNISFETSGLTFEVYGNNLLNKHARVTRVLRSRSAIATLGDWSDNSVVVRPREVGLRVSMNF